MTSLQRMPRTQLLAITAVLILVAMVFANFLDIGGNDDGNESGVGGFLALSAFGIAVTALLLLVVVPRLGAGGGAALVFGVLAIITVVVFWSTLPFAFGAAALAASSPRDDQPAATGTHVKAGAALGLLAWLAALVLCVIG